MDSKSNSSGLNHQLSFDSSTAMLEFNDQRTRLDLKTAQLLSFFLAHQDQVIERKTLSTHLWQDYQASSASLSRLISVLRKHLGCFDHQFIFTLHKTGYRFVIPADVNLVEHVLPQQITSAKVSDSEPATRPAATSREHKSSWFWRPWFMLLPLSLLVGAGNWLFGLSEAPQQKSNRVATSIPRIALLPFKSESDQGDNALFTEGLSSEVLNNSYLRRTAQT